MIYSKVNEIIIIIIILFKTFGGNVINWDSNNTMQKENLKWS